MKLTLERCTAPLSHVSISRLVCLDRHCFDQPWNKSLLQHTISDTHTTLLIAKTTTNSPYCHRNKPSDTGYIIYRCVAENADIFRIGTHKNYRRRGVGTYLLSRMVDHLQSSFGTHCGDEDRSIINIFLEVGATNTPAIKLYQSYGFVQCGLRKHYYPLPKRKKDSLPSQREHALVLKKTVTHHS